jgi:hypothetical protein
MLLPPSKGFGHSVNTHQVQLDALAEWIEGCITFVDDEISAPDIADILIEENVYQKQDFAKERIDDALLELGRRAKCLGDVCPFEIHGIRLKRIADWKDTPAYAFCLMLGLQVAYRDIFRKAFPNNYLEQGILFEQLTAEALTQLGWRTHSPAWSKKAANSIRAKIEALALHLGEAHRSDAVDRWSSDDAKDGGLDVVCDIPFSDGWPGRPLFYVQCASGAGWKDKRGTPNLALWDKLLDLATRPKRGIAMPFALLADDFRKEANYDHLSLLLDRHRVSSPINGLKRDWLSPTLSQALNKWTDSRLQALNKAKAG